MRINIRKLIISIAIPLIVGGTAAFFTRDSMMQFESVNQQSLSPPSWLFPVVWTILYTLMGISSYLISESTPSKEAIEDAQTIYYFQLGLNFLCPLLFFGLNWYLFAFLELTILWVAVAVMIRRFLDISPLAAYLNVPYLIWLTFAAYLNLGVWWLNR